MINYKLEVAEWLRSERSKATSNKTFQKGFIGARQYPHFDTPISLSGDPASIGKLTHKLSDSKILSKWQFFPFILRNQRVRRYRHNLRTSAMAHRDQKKQTHIKSRPIMVAAHEDACLFALHSYIFTPYYEKLLAQRNIQDNVVAYRSIHGSNNVDFAKRAFDYMQSQTEMACLLLDIKGFFDNIDHQKLRDALSAVLEVKQLPAEVEHVIQNLTAYRYINEDNMMRELKRVKKSYLIKIPGTDSARRICKIEDYNRHIDNSLFVKKNISGKGIPQGSPVSGILANISLLEFDCWVIKRLSKYDVKFYQRYSDDIIIVCPVIEIGQLYTDVINELQEHGVSASTKKTEAFLKQGGKLENIVSTLESGASTARQNVQYLGLEWNGSQITLRPSTIARRLRPADSRKLKPKLWKYHQSTFTKLDEPTPLKKQFYRIRKSLNNKKS